MSEPANPGASPVAGPMIVHGIPNCDTVKKARRWLDAHAVSHEFHDFKKQGIDRGTLTAWCRTLGWEALLNRRGTTWRKLAEADRDGVDEARAISLMLDNTSLIKRPVIVTDTVVLAGFDESRYEAALLE